MDDIRVLQALQNLLKTKLLVNNLDKPHTEDLLTSISLRSCERSCSLSVYPMLSRRLSIILHAYTSSRPRRLHKYTREVVPMPTNCPSSYTNSNSGGNSWHRGTPSALPNRNKAAVVTNYLPVGQMSKHPMNSQYEGPDRTTATSMYLSAFHPNLPFQTAHPP